MRPDSLELTENRDALILRWSAERADEIPAARLRIAARDAATMRQRIDFGEVFAPSDLTIERVDRIGGMGVNLAFSDGHDRAIYPWSYLREIAEQVAAENVN